MSKGRDLRRSQLNKRLDARANPRRVSRYCSCCANHGGINSSHSLCPVCLSFTAEALRCCGTQTIAISSHARVPKKSASRKVWKTFIHRFAATQVQAHVQGCDECGCAPNPGWVEFLETWEIPRRPVRVVTETPRPRRLNLPKKEVKTAAELLPHGVAEALEAAYGAGVAHVEPLPVTGRRTARYHQEVNEQLARTVAQQLRAVVRVVRAMDGADGKRLGRALLAYAQAYPDDFDRFRTQIQSRIGARMQPSDALPFLTSADEQLRQAGLWLVARARKRTTGG